MKTIAEYIQDLKVIIESDSFDKQSRIDKFQDEILNLDEIESDISYDILHELAYDFEFYVQNTEHRREFYGYYGDDKLNELILEAIKKL
jgi:hypothetical protein